MARRILKKYWKKAKNNLVQCINMIIDEYRKKFKERKMKHEIDGILWIRRMELCPIRGPGRYKM